MLEATGDAGATVGVLAAPTEPDRFAASVLDYQRVVVSVLGIHPGDLEQRSGSESGYAISLKRSAQREWAKRHETTMRDTDRQLLTLLAKVSNTFSESTLPESGWSVLYQYADDPVAEKMERFEYDRAQVESGLLSRVDWLRSLRPGMTEDQAMQQLVESAAIEQALTPEGLGALIAASPEPDLMDGVEVGEKQLIDGATPPTEDTDGRTGRDDGDSGDAT